MPPPRASWKGYLKLAELTCPVALYAAATASDRIELHTVNRATGHRVNRQFVDADTGEPVPREEQVKGYEVGKDEYVVLEPEEVAAAVPRSDKTLTVSSFIDETEADDVYFDRPYYLTPSDRSALEAFALIREGLRRSRTAAIAEAVLFRRARTLLIRALGPGLAATTLNFEYEVRSANETFADVPPVEIKGEMLELAEHIINTKRGDFDAASFHDRYEAALAELVRAKLEGRAIERPRPPKVQAGADLLAALRESAGFAPEATAPRGRAKSRAKSQPRRGSEIKVAARKRAS
ncbi:MAG: Ku protein [Hyphomicrobiales bacterium]|nr:Ku protein [Hyphomicrobiales bacterium]